MKKRLSKRGRGPFSPPLPPPHTHTTFLIQQAVRELLCPFYRLKIDKQQIGICSRPHSWRELITSLSFLTPSLDLSMNPLLGQKQKEENPKSKKLKGLTLDLLQLSINVIHFLRF